MNLYTVALTWEAIGNFFDSAHGFVQYLPRQPRDSLDKIYGARVFAFIIAIGMTSPWLSVMVILGNPASLMAVLFGSVAGGRGKWIAVAGSIFILGECVIAYAVNNNVHSPRSIAEKSMSILAK